MGITHDTEQKLIGLERLELHLDLLIRCKKLFPGVFHPVPHVILPIDRGNGQSAATEHVANLLKQGKLRYFAADKLPCYVFNPEAGEEGLKKLIRELIRLETGGGRYQGVVGIDLAVFVKWYDENTVHQLIKELKKHMDETTFLLFVPEKDSAKRRKLVEHLEEGPGRIMFFPRERFTPKDLAWIAAREMRRMGIIEPEDGALHDHLLGIFRDRNGATAKEAVLLAREMARAVMMLCAMQDTSQLIIDPPYRDPDDTLDYEEVQMLLEEMEEEKRRAAAVREMKRHAQEEQKKGRRKTAGHGRRWRFSWYGRAFRLRREEET